MQYREKFQLLEEIDGDALQAIFASCDGVGGILEDARHTAREIGNALNLGWHEGVGFLYVNEDMLQGDGWEIIEV